MQIPQKQPREVTNSNNVFQRISEESLLIRVQSTIVPKKDSPPIPNAFNFTTDNPFTLPFNHYIYLFLPKQYNTQAKPLASTKPLFGNPKWRHN